MTREPHMSSRGSSPGSNDPRAPAFVGRWIPATSAGMTPTRYWFKPKTYGYGATPANWQGWVATGVFVIGVMALSLLLLGMEPKPGTGLGSWRIGIWTLMVAGLTVGFIWLSGVKSDGQWGWRWGK